MYSKQAHYAQRARNIVLSFTFTSRFLSARLRISFPSPQGQISKMLHYTVLSVKGSSGIKFVRLMSVWNNIIVEMSSEINCSSNAIIVGI